MRAVMVVVVSPVFGHPPYLGQAGEHVAIEHLRAEGSVEAFDERVLRRLARLDMDKLHGMTQGPIPQRCATRITHMDGRRVSISIRNDSRLKSSLILKVWKRRPDHRASHMKSGDHV